MTAEMIVPREAKQGKTIRKDVEWTHWLSLRRLTEALKLIRN